MLKRHGTRLDIGTAEDVAELNAAEALLRASYKPTPMSTGSGGGGGGGGVEAGCSYVAAESNRQGGSGLSAFGNARTAGSYRLSGAATGSAATAGTGVDNPIYYPSPTAGGGRWGDAVQAVTTTPTAYHSAGAAPLALPHVHLGHSANRASPTTTTTITAGATAPTPASASSSVSVHAQRALYRSGAGTSDTTTAMMSPSGRPSGASTVTGYASSTGRTSGGVARPGIATAVSAGGSGGLRGPAQPLFHTPYNVDNEAENGDDEDVYEQSGYDGEEKDEEDHGQPSTQRAPFVVPVPAAAASVSRPVRRGDPLVAPPLPLAPPPYGGVTMEGCDEEEEEMPARPSRASGRY